jgi:DNA-binding response OmpR family regulator
MDRRAAGEPEDEGGYDDRMSGPARILVVEDEARIAEVVQGYLEAQGHTVTWVATGEAALAAAASRRPDLVVLDLGLPGMPGEDVCRRLRAESDVPIIMLTAKDAEEDLVRGLQLGADDYLTKPFSPRELTARVRALLRRARADAVPQADLLERAGGRLSIDSPRRRVTLDGEPVDLTESEFRLLQALARFPGRVYTRSELVERLQGMEFEPYERTIDAHIKNLRRKLGDDARAPRLVLTVYGRGYSFAEDQR